MQYSNRVNARLVGKLACALCLTCACGCGSGTATVHGKVTLGGRPVTYGSIILASPDGTARSAALAPDGSYTVKDVQAGEVRVAVLTPDPARGQRPKRLSGPPAKIAAIAKADPSRPRWTRVPEKYGNPTTSGITHRVSAGDVAYDVDLQ
jgi:hypothetical protein